MRTMLATLCALGLGCAHSSEVTHSEDLDHAVDLYWKASHWQDAVAGATFVEDAQRTQWLRTRDKEEKNLSVTSWEVQGEKVNEAGGTATALVKVTWYQLPSTIEQTDVVEQRWVLHKGTWSLASEKGGPLPFPAKDEPATPGAISPR